MGKENEVEGVLAWRWYFSEGGQGWPPKGGDIGAGSSKFVSQAGDWQAWLWGTWIGSGG